MRLELDMGNTFVKWRLLESSELVRESGRVETASDFAAFFSNSAVFSEVNELFVSSVSRLDMEDTLCALFNARASCIKVYRAKAQKNMCGVEFVYKEMGRLGIDRCLAMIAAYARYQAGVLVIDCGSAITADLVLPSGKHVGGYIFPGFKLLERSLLSGTSNIIVNTRVEQDFDFGRNTEECVGYGVNMMARSTLLGVIELAATYDVFDVLLTGGDGLKAARLLGGRVEYDKDLVFKGLGMAGSCSLEI